MSEPERRQVRVRRSPRIGVFLGIGAVVGALVAIVAGDVAPPDPTVPTSQAIGYLLLIFAPLGAIVGGAIALVVDRITERGARTVEAERLLPPPRVEDPTDAPLGPVADGAAGDVAEPAPEADRTDRG